MKVAVLASGSSGNAIWVSGGSSSVLIDAGISGRRIGTAAAALGLDADGLSGILVTHEHSDHVSGLGPAARRYGAPVYASAGTHAALDGRLGPRHERVIVEPGTDFEVGGLIVSAFAVSHDCAEPVGYSISDGESRVAIATDLGVVSGPVRYRLSEADCVVLEFNHDERMLLDGGYPWFLKKRIMGSEGHLSNDAAARELVALADCPMSALVLAHLSGENNTPELALESARRALDRAGRADVRIHVAGPSDAIGPVRIGSDVDRDTAEIGAEAACTG